MKTKISIRLFAIALTVAFTTAFMSPAMANDDKKGIPVELKFVGTLTNKPLFHLVFSGTEQNEFTIIVRDLSGNIFYKKNVKGASFLEKFLLNTDDFDGAELEFEISSKNYDKPVVFKINNRSEYVENIVVSKVN
jgi:hypothetical protein